MKLADFSIGTIFRSEEGDSRVLLCVDIGTRTVVAVYLTVGRRNDWGRGLPDDVQERLWGDDLNVEPANQVPLADALVHWRSLGTEVFGEGELATCVPHVYVEEQRAAVHSNERGRVRPERSESEALVSSAPSAKRKERGGSL